MLRFLPLFLVACSGGDGKTAPKNDDTDVEDTDAGEEPEPEIQVDRHLQSDLLAIDVLLVIDSTSSMSAWQGQLQEFATTLASVYVGSGADYHLGVITMDMQDPVHRGRLRDFDNFKFVNDTVPNPITVFEGLASVGVNGHYDSEGRAATFTALEILKNGYNAGFVRDEAELLVIFVSDAQDGSTQPTLPEFNDWLLDYKPSGSMVTVNAITGQPGAPCVGAGIGFDFIDVVDNVGGAVWDICAPEWVSLLSAPGALPPNGPLEREFFLTQLPVTDPYSLEVSVVDDGNTFVFVRDPTGDPNCEDCYDYSETRNSITFNSYVPASGSEIVIEYEVLSR